MIPLHLQLFGVRSCGIPDCNWDEYPNNPVYDPPAPLRAFYQTVRYNQQGFAPFGSTAFYKMWYDFASAGGIALATSPDGIQWSFQANMNGLVPPPAIPESYSTETASV
jgi:hypothetical protein